jgi:hypothetical protein
MSAPGPPTTPKPPACMTSLLISMSIFDATIDLSMKEGSGLYEIGSAALPNTFSGHGKDIQVFINSLKNQSKKCNWNQTILQVKVGNETLHLLRDYGRIPMSVLKELCQDRKDHPPTSLAQARTTINSRMMFMCIEKSLETPVSTKLLKQATSIDCDGPVMFKQIIENTFITTMPTTFATKTELFSLDLQNLKNNMVTFHEDVRKKVISLKAFGHQTASIDLLVSLFMAYGTSDNDLFKLEVCLLKSSYDHGSLSTQAIEAKYDELVKTDRWKPSQPKEDPNLVALTATVKTLTEALRAKDKSGSNSSSKCGGARGTAWKYNSSLGSNGTYTPKVEGKESKDYKWCTGPGHGGKPMWVCGHEPGSCNKNYDRNASQNSKDKAGKANSGNHSSSAGNSENSSEASIQALRAVLENTEFGDDPSTQISACLALLRG